MIDRWVSVVSTIMVDCTFEDAVAVVTDMTGLPLYEEKVDDVGVFPEDAGTGLYHLDGRVLGLFPWNNTFRYEFHGSGFHSYQAFRPVKLGFDVSGGFTVCPLRYGCLIIHYEEYRVPWFMLPFKFLIGSYLTASMKPEMRTIRRLIDERRQLTPAA